MHTQSVIRMALSLALSGWLGLGLVLTPVHAAGQIDISGPAGSGGFGTSVTALPNGNFVVTDPLFDAGLAVDAGAVYLYHGATLALISTLTGTAANDRVGSGPVTVLNNGNFVVRSTYWAGTAGAVTWCSGVTGCTGGVSASNSLVGSQPGDRIGSDGIPRLVNGNYVVQSPSWANGAAAKAGAVTWCSGTAGCAGEVSASNSLVGTHSNDQVGFYPDRVLPLPNGNYVVPSPMWDNGTTADAGAVTLCSGTAGCQGAVTTTNSLVGTQIEDQVGGYGAVALAANSYIVQSPDWANGSAAEAGAVTRCSAATGCSGPVTAGNSLVGSTAGDQVGLFGVVILPNGSYVVNNYWWSNAGLTKIGAVTWCSGATGCTGAVSAGNSLVGSRTNDQVGFGGVDALSTGNYVVRSIWWNGAGTKLGAVTLCRGTTGCSGAVTLANSLVGALSNDQIGFGGVEVLTNGNYVVSSPLWDNAATVNAGAVTWCSGVLGCGGQVVSAANSLVGSSPGDSLGGVTRLTDGNYVVSSLWWTRGAAGHAGAATWCSGTIGCTGAVSAANSLVGTQTNDEVGSMVHALTHGGYVVSSPNWANAGSAAVGAVTWCGSPGGCTGPVTSANSLVGSTVGDQIGDFIAALPTGDYVVSSRLWSNGALLNAGAVTWCRGAAGCTGPVTSGNSLVGSTIGDQVGNGWGGVWAAPNGMVVVQSPAWDGGAGVDSGAVTWAYGMSSGLMGPITSLNSVLGTVPGGGAAMNFDYDPQAGNLVVGRPADNKVTVISVSVRLFLPLVLN